MGRADDGFPDVGISSRVVPGVLTNEKSKKYMLTSQVPVRCDGTQIIHAQ
jgi:hypothetical protein